MENRRTWGIAVVLGFLIPFFVWLVPLAPNLAGSGSPAYSLSPASDSQQTLLIPTSSFNGVPVGKTIPVSIEIPSLYLNLSQKYKNVLSLPLTTGSVIGGNNVTFSVNPQFAVPQGITVLHVFLFSPEGLLVATSPPGDTLTQSGFYQNVYGFKVTYYNTYAQQNAITTALASGTLKFTYEIPASDASVGTWKIFAFLEISVYKNGQQLNEVGLGAASFTVPQHSNIPGPLSSAYDIFQFLATWAFIAGVAKFAIDRYPANWVRKNWPLVLGSILMAVYLILRFFVF